MKPEKKPVSVRGVRFLQPCACGAWTLEEHDCDFHGCSSVEHNHAITVRELIAEGNAQAWRLA